MVWCLQAEEEAEDVLFTDVLVEDPWLRINVCGYHMAVCESEGIVVVSNLDTMNLVELPKGLDQPFGRVFKTTVLPPSHRYRTSFGMMTFTPTTWAWSPQYECFAAGAEAEAGAGIGTGTGSDGGASVGSGSGSGSGTSSPKSYLVLCDPEYEGSVSVVDVGLDVCLDGQVKVRWTTVGHITHPGSPSLYDLVAACPTSDPVIALACGMRTPYSCVDIYRYRSPGVWQLTQTISIPATRHMCTIRSIRFMPCGTKICAVDMDASLNYVDIAHNLGVYKVLDDVEWDLARAHLRQLAASDDVGSTGRAVYIPSRVIHTNLLFGVTWYRGPMVEDVLPLPDNSGFIIATLNTWAYVWETGTARVSTLRDTKLRKVRQLEQLGNTGVLGLTVPDLEQPVMVVGMVWRDVAAMSRMADVRVAWMCVVVRGCARRRGGANTTRASKRVKRVVLCRNGDV